MTDEQFANLSYKQQVQLFKTVALKAIEKYPIKLKKIKFINHGENTTFKITDSRHRRYLLRICRKGYHTDKAVAEELSWLKNLSSKSFKVPTPQVSKQNKLFEKIKTSERPDGVNVVVFKWTEGKFLKKTISEKQMQQLGQLVADLHKHSKSKFTHRKYWTTEGLVGKRTKFGSLEHIVGATKQQQKLISKKRKAVFTVISKFEKENPERMGYIHADLHSGNFLFNKNGVTAIDFDDSGFGFFGYDIAIPLMSLDRFKSLSVKRKTFLKQVFLASYKKSRSWDKLDEEMLPYFILARRLLMLAWLNSRSDNPKLKTHLKKYLNDIVKKLDYPNP